MVRPFQSRVRRPRGATAAAAALALAAAAPAAFAYPDALVEARTRPDFGWLLQPPTWPGRPCGPAPCCGGPACGPRFGPPIGPIGPPLVGPPIVGPPVLNRIVVDCGRWHAHMIERALSQLRPGGTLILRTHGGACTEPIFITRSVQIVGDGGPDLFGPYDHAAFPLAHAVLNAPPGQPCISVAPGVRAVSIRGLVINAPAAGGAACIQASDAQVEVSDTVIRYVGGGSAINVEGGAMLLQNLGVSAQTPAPAIVSEGADVKFEDLRLAATQLGLLVEPGSGASQLVRVFARALPGGSPGPFHPTTGLMVRSGAAGPGRVDVLDAVMLGFSTGVRIDHDVKADLRFGRIAWSRVGVLTEGLASIRGMTIGASEVGVYARAGVSRIVLNRIYGVRYAAIFADLGAKVWAAGNIVYPWPDCRLFADPSYNAAGQVCQPWTALPEPFRSEGAYTGAFQDGWSEWNYNWAYDPGTDAWRAGPGAGPPPPGALVPPDPGPPGDPPPPADGPAPPGPLPPDSAPPGPVPPGPVPPGPGPADGPTFLPDPPPPGGPVGPIGPVGPPGPRPGPRAYPGPLGAGAGYVLQPGVPTYTSPSLGVEPAPPSPSVENDPNPR